MPAVLSVQNYNNKSGNKVGKIPVTKVFSFKILGRSPLTTVSATAEEPIVKF